MRIKKLVVGVAVMLLVSALWSFAEISMPRIFSDNMMLQCGKPVKVWGWASPNSEVVLKFGTQTKTATADKNGDWSVFFEPLKADKNPKSIFIAEGNSPAKEIKNVLVGEIWILGGQSNMEWVVFNTDEYKNAKKRANYPQMRYFNQASDIISASPLKDTRADTLWLETTPASFGSFSAVGFYFAECLTKDLDVPVGLVCTPLGGSSMRAWIPESRMGQLPILKAGLEKFKQGMKSYDYPKAYAEWEKRIAEFKKSEQEAKASGKPAPKPMDWLLRKEPSKITNISSQATPSYLYNAKIAPLAGFAARGFLWYQGESDAGANVADFKSQFDLLVHSWRRDWNEMDMPFYWVQLTSFKSGNVYWPETRWAQYQSMKSLSNSGMANTVDLGQQDNIHPRDKDIVASRLEKIVLRDVYGFDGIHPYGPMPSKFSYGAFGAKVEFDLDGLNLVCKGNPRGFEVLIDGNWTAANAVLSGNSVIVSGQNPSDNSKICGVRYLWKGWARPDVCLFNSEGLPALSFTNKIVK